MKTFITFILGIGSGLAIAYYLDPKGSQKKLKKMEKELKKNRKLFDKKVVEYKDKYEHVVDSVSKPTKELIDQAKDALNKVKNTETS